MPLRLQAVGASEGGKVKRPLPSCCSASWEARRSAKYSPLGLSGCAVTVSPSQVRRREDSRTATELRPDLVVMSADSNSKR